MIQDLRRLTGIIAALVLGAGAATAGQTVTKYVGDTVRTYTKDGQPAGEVKSSSLPKEVLVEGQDARGHPGIKVNNQMVYLKASDVFITDSDAPVCQDLALNGKKAGSQLAATAGVRHGAAEKAVPCIK